MLRSATSRPPAARRFRADERASTAIEYALIASLVGAGILVGLTGTRDSVAGSFQNLLERVAAVLDPTN